MDKSIHSKEYQAVLKKLISMRQAAGLSQQQLADKMGREQSFIWRLEKGERRIDVIEFYWICNALHKNASTAYSEIIESFDKNHVS